MRAQGLDRPSPFGAGPSAALKAIEHLGYVQIDTINVIERCHHHILFTRVADYERSFLHQLQAIDKSVFEYWTHALAYVATKDYRYFMGDMRRRRLNPNRWYDSVTPADKRKVLALIKKNGPISIRDIGDDILVEKDHEWASRKPSKKALQLGFNGGQFVVSERLGMLKKYDLTTRHFDYENTEKPIAASEDEVRNYVLDRALRSQSFVSLDSVCYLDPAKKKAMHQLIESRVKSNTIVPIQLKGHEKKQFWIQPQDLETRCEPEHVLTHILSPFDPLIIMRKRLQDIFGYEHFFEAYVPPAKRKFGYFSLPVLIGEQIVAVLDLKADRQQTKLLIQNWTWLPGGKSSNNKKTIEEELDRFERFQFSKS